MKRITIWAALSATADYPRAVIPSGAAFGLPARFPRASGWRPAWSCWKPASMPAGTPVMCNTC
jgi:hypothetical protein